MCSGIPAAAASPVKPPSASDLVTLAQAGATIYFYRWGCFETTETEVRIDVAMIVAKFVHSTEVPTLMKEFDRELDRLGFGNPYTKRQCDKRTLKFKEDGYANFKESLNGK